MNTIEQVKCVENVTQVNVFSMPDETCFLSNLFLELQNDDVNVDMICRPLTHTRFTRLSFTVSDSDLAKVVQILTRLKQQYSKLKFSLCASNCKLVVSGSGMFEHPGAAAAVFSTLCSAGVDILLISTGENEISVLVPGADALVSKMYLEQLAARQG